MADHEAGGLAGTSSGGFDFVAAEAEREYRVRWEIDLSATSRVNAARQALITQRKADSIATVFEVTEHEPGQDHAWELADEIDLSEIDGYPDTSQAAPGQVTIDIRDETGKLLAQYAYNPLSDEDDDGAGDWSDAHGRMTWHELHTRRIPNVVAKALGV